MPDNGPFSDRELERDLRDLGARIEYPPTPDLSQAVRRQIDEEDAGRQARRGGFWPSLLSPRWAATAAAVVLIAVAVFSPAVRGTISDLIVSEEAANSGQQAGAGGSAARPDSGGAEDAGSSAASRAQPTSGEDSSRSATPDSAIEAAGVATCPSLSLEARPARAAPETTFRLHGDGFSTVCDKSRPAQDIRIEFRQDGRIWKLATVDADRQLTFDARLRVPAGARQGQATVRATTRTGELVKEQFLVLR
jgi:hypothetical protein